MKTVEIKEAIARAMNDLNACQQMEQTLTDEEWVDYCAELVNRAPTFPQYGLGSGTDKARRLVSATAAQKAEAFLRAKSLWQDQPQPERE